MHRRKDVDVVAPEAFDLRPHVPQLIDRPITRVEFGFSPEAWWPGPRQETVDDDAHLFLRGFPPLPPGTRFPVRART